MLLGLSQRQHQSLFSERAMSPHLKKPLPICFFTGMVILIVLPSSLRVIAEHEGGLLARPGCQDTCGNVSIPFPFGIGPNCFLDTWFEIKCEQFSESKGSSKPFLSKFDVEVIEITLGDISHDGGFNNDQRQDRLSSLTVGIPSFNMCSGSDTHQLGIDLRGSPFNFSTEHNVLIMEGCPGSAVLFDQSNTIIAGCGTFCDNGNKTAVSANTCLGVECCQMPLPFENYDYDQYGLDQYSPLQFYQIGFHCQSPGKHHNCLVASLIKNEFVDHYTGKLLTTYPTTVPVLLYWSWVSSNWPDTNSYAYCWRDGSNNVTYCYCAESFGNIYVLNGCQVAEECKHCHGDCNWNERNSSFHCYSNRGNLFFGNIFGQRSVLFALTAYIAVAAAIGSLLTVFGYRWLYHFIKRRRKTNRRVKFFKQKLLQHQSSSEGIVERTKLYTKKHLAKATNNFDETQVLGRGGQGIVYKGMLRDGRIVAIKKSNLVDESQMEQFINEVVILSQINHRNVVKLFGCCLETEVPFLVYEFISNGTLAQHIHDPDQDFALSWPMRWKIAADSAGAIAYLHSSSSTPIYHRDIKPSNILLDDKHRAKVSDFGSSKTITLDQTHLTTLVQGTMGYLDPEYFESNMFTDKSDVYSFGVVLLELLTSKKAIYKTETMEQKSLVVEFFLQMQNSSLSNILDPEVLREARQDELLAIVDLAKRCLNGSRRLRPTMKEVAMTLEMIIQCPVEMSTRDRNQTSLDNRFGEIVMYEMSDAEFISTPARATVASPLYIDEHPLLRGTI